jgi:hypothetical protein
MREEHSTFREGIVSGVIGALVVGVWYFLIDAAAGRPFHTPNVLGKIFFRGDVTPEVRSIVPAAVAAYTVVHVLMFVVAGMGLTLLAHMASRNLSLRMGIWIGLVVAWCFFAGVTYTVALLSGERLPLWTIIIGSLLGASSMAAYLWRRHPRLGRPLQDHSRRAEVEAPPHPPGAPRV